MPPVPEPEPQKSVSAEAVLKEALTRIWEQARSLKFNRISRLELKVFDPGDGFKLMGLVGGISKAEKKVEIQGDYETEAGSELAIEFKGTVTDAMPVKDFLDPQLRAAADKDVSVIFRIEFTDGLDLAGGDPEKLAERLTRFGTGAVFVSATAAGAS